MRVTHSLMANNFLSSFMRTSEAMMELQQKVSTGIAVSKPSDDPVAMTQILNYKKTMSAIDQYDRNIDHGQAWLGTTLSALEQAEALLNRAEELTEEAATGTMTAENREAIAEEVKEIYDELMQIANTQYNGSYIFAGTETGTAPYSRDANYNATYNGSSTVATAEVSTVQCTDPTVPPGITDGSYFHLSSTDTVYQVWYDTDGDGSPAPSTANAIRVDISGAANADDVATATANAINAAAGTEFTAGAAGDLVTITNTQTGHTADTSDSATATGFTFATTVQGTSGTIKLDIAAGVMIDLNINGEEVFSNTNGNFFDTLRDLITALESNDQEGIEASLEDLETVQNEVLLPAEAKVGAVINRLDSTQVYLEDFRLDLKELLSETEDIDYLQAITDLAMAETAYNAALMVSSRIIQPSLVNYM
jgi:flagellar hook-associated protein 3 FlgL